MKPSQEERSGQLYQLAFARFPELEVEQVIGLAEEAERLLESGQANGQRAALESLARRTDRAGSECLPHN